MGNNRYTLRHFSSMMVDLEMCLCYFFPESRRGKRKKIKRNINAIKKNRKWKYLKKKYFNYMKTCLGQVNKKRNK